MTAFFPALTFAWTFFTVLMVLLLMAAYVDYRTFKIPKSLVFAILGTGLVANLVRGGWMGANGAGIFLFRESNVWLGVIDGFLFALVGFLAAFTVLFVLWILKTCGGGDVKLLAALGAWLGPVLIFFAWMGSVFVLILLFLGSLGVMLLSGRPMRLSKKGTAAKPGKWHTSYSLPVAIATAFLLLWLFRGELGLVTPPSGSSARAQIHAK